MNDRVLAISIAAWLESKGCATTVVAARDSSMHMVSKIYYTLANDTKPQPAIVVRDGSVVFPAGTNVGVLFAYYNEVG